MVVLQLRFDGRGVCIVKGKMENGTEELAFNAISPMLRMHPKCGYLSLYVYKHSSFQLLEAFQIQENDYFPENVMLVGPQ